MFVVTDSYHIELKMVNCRKCSVAVPADIMTPTIYVCTKLSLSFILLGMRIDWDDSKNKRNTLKHRLSFATARLVFDDPFHVSIIERVVDGEEHWQSIGMIAGVLIVVGAHTVGNDDGGNIIRIISARTAERNERIRYEEGAY